MNKKRIKEHLTTKLNNWLDSIEDDNVAKLARKNVLVTGGALVSLLNGETPNDYDLYFKTKGACKAVAEYYAERYDGTYNIEVEEKEDRILLQIRSGKGGNRISDTDTDTDDDVVADTHEDIKNIKIRCPKCKDSWNAKLEGKHLIVESGDIINPNKKAKCFKCGNEYDIVLNKKYTAKYFSANAITLSDDIQIVIRFFGEVEDIHKNYDFVHCTCSYDLDKNELNFPTDALLAIINKELKYCGSKYPICSLIRARKFINRGYHISAGQFLKMCYQIKDLDLYNIEVLREQLCGVDSAYFNAFIHEIDKFKNINTKQDAKPDNEWLMQTINRIFDGE